MAYGTISSPTDISDLIGDIVTLLTTHCGYTDEGLNDSVRAVSKGGVYINFKEFANASQVNCKTGESVLMMWPGYTHLDDTANFKNSTAISTMAYIPTMISFFNVAGPFSNLYWFADSASLHCVLEVTSGAYVHFGICRLTEFASTAQPGGEYVYGQADYYDAAEFQDQPQSSSSLPFPGYVGNYNNNSFPSAYPGRIRIANNGTIEDWATVARSGIQQKTISSTLYQWDLARGPLFNGHYAALEDIGYSRLSNRAPLVELPIYIQDTVQTDIWRPWGYAPLMRYVDMTNLVPASIEDTDWQVFPIGSKVIDRSSFSYYSGKGFAYKRVA